MTHIPVLNELALIAGLGVVVSVLLAKLKLPTVAGLLSAGALLGPHGLGLVRSADTIEVLAEIGVVLLLFTIGLEFSLERLSRILRSVAVGGVLQLGLTCGATVLVAVLLGEPVGRGVFYGFVVTLSSTAIVLRALAERSELDAPHGRFIVGTLIFQDLAVVPMVLVVPLLAGVAGIAGAGAAGSAATEIMLALAKAAAVVVATIVVARLVVPRILDWVDASRSREVFLLAVLGLCIGTAWLTSRVGLSLALGAFLGGMVVAGTEYGHRAMGDILPLRDVFVSIFFVSLGMLFDVNVVSAQPLAVGGLLFGFLFGKAVLATLAALAMGFPSRVALLAGVGLAQFGEFGFVLARLGETSGVVDSTKLGPLLAAGILSMFLTPLLVRLAPHLAAGEQLLAPLERRIGGSDLGEADAHAGVPSDHVVVVGFGLAGRLAVRALAACGTRYVVLELNAETVRTARAAGEPAFYADATSIEALGHAHLVRARALLLLINDPSAVERIADTARRVAPHVPIVTRTRYEGERAGLLARGVSDVIVEEVEGAVEIVARLLRRLDVPGAMVDEQIEKTRRSTSSAPFSS
jgi:CPA2 family monovalent cation:H+ antiporter-2